MPISIGKSVVNHIGFIPYVFMLFVSNYFSLSFTVWIIISNW